MTAKKEDKFYVQAGKGVFIEDLAKKFKLHPNTILGWIKRLGIRRGLMMGPAGVRKQALTHADAKRWEDKYRATGGLDLKG